MEPDSNQQKEMDQVMEPNHMTQEEPRRRPRVKKKKLMEMRRKTWPLIAPTKRKPTRKQRLKTLRKNRRR